MYFDPLDLKVQSVTETPGGDSDAWGYPVFSPPISPASFCYQLPMHFFAHPREIHPRFHFSLRQKASEKRE